MPCSYVDLLIQLYLWSKPVENTGMIPELVTSLA